MSKETTLKMKEEKGFEFFLCLDIFIRIMYIISTECGRAELPVRSHSF